MFRLKTGAISKSFPYFLLLAFLTILRYHAVLRSFWLYDDPYILRHAFERHPWEYFFIPDVWRELSIRYLTPWVVLSFDVDLSLFGFRPQFFYFHQVASLWLSACAVFMVLRLWVKAVFALFGSAVFLLSAPAAAATEMLQIRHYVEGLVFCLGSLYCFVQSLRRESCVFALLSSVLYFLAMSAKELYVPFGVVMLFLPENNIRQRVRRWLPILSVGIVYAMWRVWMLGDLIAGPGEKGIFAFFKDLSSIKLLAHNIFGTVLMIAGIPTYNAIVKPSILLIFVIFVSCSLFFLLKERRYSMLFFFFGVSVAIYSVPLTVFLPYTIAHDFPAYRIIFFISAYISGLIALCGDLLYRRITGVRTNVRLPLQICLVMLMMWVVGIVQWNTACWIAEHREHTIRPLACEGRFFTQGDRHAIIVKSDAVNAGVHYYENLEFFRRYYLGTDAPLVVYNGFAYLDRIHDRNLEGRRAFMYDTQSREMKEHTKDFLRQRSAVLSRIDKMPFSVSAIVNRGFMHFVLGPSDSGHYFLLWGHKPDLYSMYIDLGQERVIQTRGLTRLQVYCRFGWESPEMRVTLSPEWFIDFSKNQQFIWSQ